MLVCVCVCMAGGAGNLSCSFTHFQVERNCTQGPVLKDYTQGASSIPGTDLDSGV